MPEYVYTIYLAVSRWVLPILSLCMAVLWIKGFRSVKPTKRTLAQFVTREGECSFITVAEGFIGRKKHCDVFLPHVSVEKKHAMFFQEDGKWMLSPLQGEVYLNEKPLTKTAPLLHGDVVAFGEEEYIFECNDLEAEELLSQTPVKGGLLLFCLTLFQLIMGGQLCLRFFSELTPYLPLCFGVLLVGEWIYFALEKWLGNAHMLWEVPVLYLTTLGFGVCTCSNPRELPKQLFCILAGIAGCIGLSFLLKYHTLCYKLRYPIGAICVGVLWFTVLFGTEIYGSTNWLSIGGVSFQPSEFAKVAFLVVGACTLPVVAKNPWNRWFFMIFAGITMGALVCMIDFGAIAIFFVTMLVLLCMRLTDWRLVAGIVVCAVLAGGIALVLFPHIATRFSSWLHVWEYADSSGYQQTRTLIAIASGGLLGVGGGNGTLLSVAASDTDLVFGVVCEEWGQLIGFCTLLCFVALTAIALRLAKTTSTGFHAMGVCGAAAMILFQTALNVFGSTDLLPLTGVTMIFVSQGGTSLMAAFFLTAFFKAAETTPSSIETERRRYY